MTDPGPTFETAGPAPCAGSPWTRWAVALAYMALIFWFSSRPSMVEQIPRDYRFPYVDRAGHAVEYALLGWLLARALAWRRGRARAAWTALLVGSLYGASDELHQAFVPNRSCQLGDLLSDAFGAGLGAGLWALVGGSCRSGAGPGMTKAAELSAAHRLREETAELQRS